MKETDFYNFGYALGQMERGRDSALEVATAIQHVALFEQLGKITRELETLQRMARQMAIDHGAKYPGIFAAGRLAR